MRSSFRATHMVKATPAVGLGSSTIRGHKAILEPEVVLRFFPLCLSLRIQLSVNIDSANSLRSRVGVRGMCGWVTRVEADGGQPARFVFIQMPEFRLVSPRDGVLTERSVSRWTDSLFYELACACSCMQLFF